MTTADDLQDVFNRVERTAPCKAPDGSTWGYFLPADQWRQIRSELRDLLATPAPEAAREASSPQTYVVGGPDCPTCRRDGLTCHPEGGLICCAGGCSRCDDAVEGRARALADAAPAPDLPTTVPGVGELAQLCNVRGDRCCGTPACLSAGTWLPGTAQLDRLNARLRDLSAGIDGAAGAIAALYDDATLTPTDPAHALTDSGVWLIQEAIEKADPPPVGPFGTALVVKPVVERILAEHTQVTEAEWRASHTYYNGWCSCGHPSCDPDMHAQHVAEVRANGSKD